MIKRVYLLFFISILVIACSSGGDSSDPGNVEDNFDRGAMLAHLADDIIIPAFEDFEAKVNTLSTEATSFTIAPTEAGLESLRTAWLNAYKTWQYVEMFNIGKAEELQFVNFINIYPVTVADVEANVLSGEYDLNISNNHDAQGFPAIDYLLYGTGATDAEILAKFTTDTNASGYNTYLTDVVAKIQMVTTDIVSDWNGVFRNEFVNSTGNSATSSLDKLINDYVFYYEKGFRANKIGTPVGNFSANPLPDRVEALYSKTVSRELALTAFTAIQDFFNGKSYNSTTEELGLKAYLEALEKEELIAAITNQFDLVVEDITALDASFYSQIQNNNEQMLETYTKVQRLVPYFKSDMLQAFDINVDFIDADGD